MSDPDKPVPRRKVLAIASGGGHFVQLLRLRPAWADCDVAYATVHASQANEVHPHPLHVFPDVSRADLWRLPRTTAAIAAILIKVRPNVVITTGALPGLIAIALAKPFGIKTLWIDSIANAEVISGSGQQAVGLADAVLTQWSHLATDRIHYRGSVV